MNELLEIFPFIKQTMIDLEQQNKFMNKVTLTGKINALHVASNLFEFTDKTAIIFDELKTELIQALLEENIKKVTNELEFKAKTTIDMLIRNLFERTADVGFLSTDMVIKEFLTTDHISTEQIKQRLTEYANKYTVYNEIVIFDTHKNVKINMNDNNNITRSNDPILQEALDSETYVECYKHTDIFKSQKETLFYAQRIMHNQEAIGVLCLCFKFEDELESIFDALAGKGEILQISNSSSVLSSNDIHMRHIALPKDEKNYVIVDKKNIAVSKKTSGYQGYNGIDDWYATALMNATSINIQHKSLEDAEHDDNNLSSRNILSDELNGIIEKANDIIEDISDVIINGELIASKQKVYVLTPILDNLRNISIELLSSIKTSVKNLEDVIEEGLMHDVKMASHLAMDIMDRNLYERANDVRWWALTPILKKELSSSTPDIDLMQKRLQDINLLYTVYTNIFVFDKDAKIVAASNDTSIVGDTLDFEAVQKTLRNKDTQNYFVSDFEDTKYYDNQPTYIYYASITDKDKRVVGGIGVVFDAKHEFEAMLKDSFPSAKKGFMLFADKDGTIIASNNSELKPLDKIDIDQKYLSMKDSHAICDYTTYQDKEYVVAGVLSNGYREYKNEDNYKNDVYCLTFVEI